MNTLVDRFGAKGLSVVAVSVDRERASAERSLKRVQPRFRVLFDSQGKAASSYAVPTMPTSYLIDRNGRIRRVLRGFRASDKASLEADIERLLGEQ
jgi:peroxiredoxin